eukprot:GFUD01045464.1.p1 GENE.GFUD01045464.1~~GFUD01045464.1.p1  ORF type:complete len:922 (-),score=231.77 GFUD01045464.1:277-3042(-)
MESPVSAALKQCQDVQHMIDITSDHLDRLRSTFSNAGDELTMQEIRTLEGKLIKQFSEQLAVKNGLGASASDLVYFPSLSQWLKVVGVSSDTNDAIRSRVRSLEELKDKPECELRRILLTDSRLSPGQRQEDLRRLCRSLLNLRKYTDALVYGDKVYGPSQDPAKLELHWDSWDHASISRSECSSPKHDFSFPPRLVNISAEDLYRSVPLPLRDRLSAAKSHQTDSAASSLSSSSSVPPPSPGPCTLSPPSLTESLPRSNIITPPATPPWVILSKERGHIHNTPASKHSAATPPAIKKHSTAISNQFSLSKSRSHESELSHRVDPESGEVRLDPTERVDSSGYSSASEAPNSGRKRLHSSEPESSQDIYQGPSPIASPKSPTGTTNSNLKVPRSPRTPGPPSQNLSLNRPMTHMIAHRFTKTFKPARCDLCQEYFFQGLKCKECKFRCHTQCEHQVPPSCGLPEQLLQEYFEHITKEGSPSLPRAQPPFDSSSSSCNSSTPSSPQVIVTSHPDTTPPWAVRSSQHFRFPEPASSRSGVHTSLGSRPPQPISLERVVSPNPAVDTVKSNDSDKTLSGSSDSIGTAYRLDSQDSTTSVEGDGGSTWSSGRQMSIREWDIPYEELKIGDKIGSGRFSTVHAGNWHGDVAIKFLDMENLDDENTLEAFRLDVATFRKTRHENLVLFMGACVKPPRLAIITSLCKGNTLYTHLHLRRDKFYMNKVIIIAQQIAQGIGYLHHKGIVHKDLKTKNIFLENGRAIITDFGLVNVARRLCSRHKRPGDTELISPDCMSIPAGWLCYLAPEVIRELRIHQKGSEDLPFTRASDVYAFGTVWYELLTGEWPWKQQPPEAIIWQVGKGIKPTLANLQASREVKDILVQCWLFNAKERPEFPDIAQTLERLPKKRLARSPSHPIHLSRSAESVF